MRRKRHFPPPDNGTYIVLKIAGQLVIVVLFCVGYLAYGIIMRG